MKDEERVQSAPESGSTTQRRHRPARPLAVVLGIAVGLLADSLLVAATTVWLGWPIALLVATPLVGGIAGYFFSRPRRGDRPRDWRFVAIVVVVLWPACALGPLLLRCVQLRIEASEVAIYPGVVVRSVRLFPVGSDRAPGFGLRMVSSDSPSRCGAFYRHALQQRGWQTNAVATSELDRRLAFVRTNRRLTVIFRKTAEGGTAIDAECLAYNFYYRPRE